MSIDQVWRRAAGLALLAACLASFAKAQEGGGASSPARIDTVTVIGAAPLPGMTIDADKAPGEVQTLSVSGLDRDRLIEVLPNLISTQLSNVSLNDEQGSQYQPDFVYRGFEASPISGVAEGLAVYQDGMRLNEALGDNVNWDLIPEFAIRSVTVQSDNPVFGLNTMGGVVTLAMKSGLDAQGLDAELSGGSFGNVTGNAEYGAKFGDFGVYLALGGLHDDGFRYQSPTTLRQAYGDLAYRHDGLTLHLSLSGASNDIAAVGPTPVEMLAQDPKAIFTHPQAMQNRMGTVQLRGSYVANDALTFSANAYYRRFDQHLTDGNTTDVAVCANDPAQLCLEGAYAFPDDALYDSQGNPAPASVLPANATPGETDFTHTRTNTYGGALQVAISTPVVGHANSLVIGASIDRGETDYRAFGELGVLQDSLQVVGSGVIIDQGQSPTAQPPIETPVGIHARNTYTGVYAIDVLDLTPRLSWTLSGRLNVAAIQLRDLMGTALNGDHSFSRFNPGTGLTYKFTPYVTAYAGYSESNRAPTAGELSCADPTSPCLLDAFLVSDPPLKQVVSHNVDFGLRGRFGAGSTGAVTWNISAFRTDADDDILLLATDINGFGFFQNAGQTRRQGIDLRLGYRDRRWTINTSYSYLDATFRETQTLSSNSPAADANGLIHVVPGDRMPLNPSGRATLSIDYAATRLWSIGGDVRWQSAQYLVGDESNQEPRLPGFATVNLRTAYRLGPHLELFGEVRNLLNRRYYTYGAFTSLDGLPPSVSLTDPRTYSPSAPRSFTLGGRLSFQ